MLSSAEIKKELQKLVGLPTWRVTFAAATLCLQFGDKHERTTRSGRTGCVGDFALHIQAFWRFSRPDEIIVGAIDHHCHDNRDNTTEIHPIIEKLLWGAPRVLAVDYVRAGAFALTLDGGLCLEVVPASRRGDEAEEFWRLFSPGTDNRHFVVTSNGIAGEATPSTDPPPTSPAH